MSPILDLKPRPEEVRDSKPAPESPASRNPASSEAARPAKPAPSTAKPKEAANLSRQQPIETRLSETQPPASKPRAGSVPVSEPINIPEPPAAAPERSSHPERPSQKDTPEFELVIGRRQIASWLFVGTVLIAVFSAAAYYIGKLSASNCLGALADQTVPYVAPAMPAATIVPPGEQPALDSSAGQPPNARSATAAAASAAPPVVSARPGLPAGESESSRGFQGNIISVGPVAGSITALSAPPVLAEPPIFAEPQPGTLYLQMGALDKGIAIVLAEGLRRHGFTSFVAPGPTEKIFRVLIGPLANQEAYKRAKAEVDAIDLSTFARRFQK